MIQGPSSANLTIGLSKVATASWNAAAVTQLLCVGFLLSCPSCDKAEQKKETQNRPQTGESNSWKQWLTKGSDSKSLKSQWDKASEIAKAAKASLDSIQPEKLKQQFADLSKAIEGQDFSKMETLAGQLDKLLTTQRLADGLRFVVMQRQQGGEATIKAIEEYSGRNDLNEYERFATQNLKKGLAVMQRQDVQGYIVLAIFFACECKLGAHQGGLLAIPVISILFPDYLDKHSSTKI